MLDCVEFKSVEEIQAHYRAVRGRIEARAQEAQKRAAEARRLAAPPLPPQPVEKTLSVAEKLAQSCPWDSNGNPIKVRKAPSQPKGEEEKPMDLPKIWLEELTLLVCDYVGKTPAEVWSHRRMKEVAQARFLIWALARQFCFQHSLPSIGRFCGRDHSTVLHGSREGKKLPAYPDLARQVQSILDARTLGEDESG